jgi:hypothetical protein
VVHEHVGWLDDVVIDADEDHVLAVHGLSFQSDAGRALADF